MCPHNHLTRLEGALHLSGTDYQCQECKELLHAVLTPLEVTVSKGRPGRTTETIAASDVGSLSDVLGGEGKP